MNIKRKSFLAKAYLACFTVNDLCVCVPFKIPAHISLIIIYIYIYSYIYIYIRFINTFCVYL